MTQRPPDFDQLVGEDVSLSGKPSLRWASCGAPAAVSARRS